MLPLSWTLPGEVAALLDERSLVAEAEAVISRLAVRP